MTDTAPYRPEADAVIRETGVHVFTVEIRDHAGAVLNGLAVISCDVEFDEYRSPYWQADVQIVLPDQALLAKLDPRLRVTCTVKAGYRYPDGVTDLQTIGIGHLAERTANAPDDTVDLKFGGKEFLYDTWSALSDAEWGAGIADTLWDNQTIARVAVGRCLEVCGAVSSPSSLDPTWDYAGAMETQKWAPAPPDEPWAPGRGDAALRAAEDIAGRIGGWFRADELGTWRLTPRPQAYGPIQHYLRGGVDGTVIAIAAELSRVKWANAVAVHYAWTPISPTDKQEANGYAKVTTGPYQESQVGRVTRSIELPWRASDANAADRARNALTSVFGSGFAYQVEAVAAYWLRPTDTIALDLGGYAPQPQLALATNVRFDLTNGRMAITTRQIEPLGLD